MARCGRTSLAEDLMMAPWWASVIFCLVGNIVIWLIIPSYLEANRHGGVTGGMSIDGYAGAKPHISQLFNLAMMIIFVFSLICNYLLKKEGNY
jgi:hypothetical protein